MNTDAAFPEDDVTRIKAVIETETRAWLIGDLELWAQQWADTDYVRRTSARLGSGATTLAGFGSNFEMMERYIGYARHHGLTEENIQRENWNMRVSADMAWVTFEQITKFEDHGQSAQSLHYQSRVLEKIDGLWKIVFISDVQTRLGYYRCPWVRVDAKARILDQNASADRILSDHSALKAENGRLLGTNSQNTGLLLDALRQASDDLAPMAECRNRPLVFENVEDGSISLCWLANFDAMLVIIFDDRLLVENAINFAQGVFGLTKGQIEVAKRLAFGSDAVTIASELGVSPSTVRTHLRRMFERLGVGHQTALVRVLMSAARSQD